MLKYNYKRESNRSFIEKELKNFYRIPKNPKVVIDIGAHMGGTSLCAARLGAQVYAYEPEEENFKFLKENVALNNFQDKIHCFKLGVGDLKLGKIRTLYVDCDSSLLHTLYENDVNKRKHLTKQIIKMTSLEKIFKDNKIKRCDCLKMDCEESEHEILYSTPKYIFDLIDNISLEITTDIDKLVPYLRKFFKHGEKNLGSEFFFHKNI